MHIEITEDEREYLMELLHNAMKEILHEIHHTDTHSFRELLKKKVALIEALTERLENKRQA